MPDEHITHTHSQSVGPIDLDVVVAMHLPWPPERFEVTLRSLRAGVACPIAVSGSRLDDRLCEELALYRVEASSMVGCVQQAWKRWGTHVLAISDAVLVPPDFLVEGLRLANDDLRVGTVSFLSNAAGFLSFPHSGQPVDRPVEGHDEVSITQQLRSVEPQPRPAPIPIGTGAAVLITSWALGALGPLDESPDGSFAGSLADFSLRGRRRGFVDLLDPSTFYARPSDLSVDPAGRTAAGLGLTDASLQWVQARHPLSHFLERERQRPDSALGLAHQSAVARIQGLRVLVEGSCLGPQEMGTQVTTVALVQALAARDDILEIVVAMPGSVPEYAEKAFSERKVRTSVVVDGEVSGLGHFDIAHRPFQPDVDFHVDAWRAAARRIVVSILDVILYQVGGYKRDVHEWLHHREVLQWILNRVDGAAVISDDVRQQMLLEQLPIEDERIFVVPYGTEHLTGEEQARAPAALVARGFLHRQFLLCLGTNYSHKNRDLALKAFTELRRRGWGLALVLAGPSVPYGSSRSFEGAALGDEDVFVVPDVASEERNWLLRHASVVLYPTSAEGFGLVPYEAARFGTPTVHVGFGPLREIAGDSPILARDWSPTSLADATEALLRDPDLARQQVEASLTAGTHYSWPRTAEGLTAMYRTLLGRPPRLVPGR